MSSFSEKSLFEIGNSNDPYYATGSRNNIGETPGSFSSALRNKEQIKVSFPVINKVKMLPNSSSIYYYNVGKAQWNIPRNSTGELNGFGNHVSLSTHSNLELVLIPGVYLEIGTSGSYFVEDDKLFDIHGNSLASGSLNIFRVSSLIDRRQKLFEESYSSENIIDQENSARYLTLDAPKSVQRNNNYSADSDEYFTLPITEPFLIEKVVFEVPFCFGNGWFNDRSALTLMTSSAGDYTYGPSNIPFKDLVSTETTVTIGDSTYTFVDVEKSGSVSVYNYGGPGITLSLMSQKVFTTGSIRDLICRGFLTHEEDTIRDMAYFPIIDGKFEGNHNFDNVWYQLTPLGIDENLTKIDAIVSASWSASNKFFTGSIVVKSEAEVSNGVRIIHNRKLVGTPGTKDVKTYTFPSFQSCMNFMSSCLDSSYAQLNGTALSSSIQSILTGVDAFGRGMTGFSPSGGSIFGSEFVTSNSDVISGGKIRNPTYFSGSKRDSILAYVSSSFTSINTGLLYGGGQYISSNLQMPSYYFIGSRKPSPYLIYPGEKIVLSISKNRPAILNFRANVPNVSSLYTGKANILSSSFLIDLKDPLGHDVQLNTGSINITFYGSYVRQGNKYIP